MAGYKIVEKFLSINGEGRRAGELACFIRFAGCNLSCGYCDTKWANDINVAYELMDENQILEYIRATGAVNVTLTGGEPLIQEDIEVLLRRLSQEVGLNIEIETNGAVALGKYIDISDAVTFTMDYKLPGSGMEDRMCLPNMDILREKDTVKFVISDYQDMEKAVHIVKKYKLDERLMVFFSSSFLDIEPKEIVEYMMKEKLNRVRLQLQLHKYIWAPDQKGV